MLLQSRSFQALPGWRVSWWAVFLLAGCSGEPWPRPPAIPLDQFAAEHQSWREERRSRLVASGSGPLTWVGLWELQPGATALGADSSLPIVLPLSEAPPRAGTLHRAGQEVRFEPARRAGVRAADGTPVTLPVKLSSDRSDSVTDLAVGSLRLRLHGEPGTDRLWLRVWDEEHPARQTFAMPAEFPLDTVWRVMAQFRRYAEPRGYRVADVTEGTQEYVSPGELRFRRAGREHRLVVFADSTSRDFLVMLWDSTALSSTYQGGRYLRVALPNTTGWTVIDFNRAYNPPCVFTPYSTCALPPSENRLALSIPAGEKRPK